jgi:hypothetical protein
VAPFVLAFAYIITAWIRFGTPAWDTRLAASIAGLGLTVPILAVVRTRLLIGGPVSAWGEALYQVRSDGWVTDRLVWFLALLGTLPAFFWAFAAWKSHIAPFHYDVRLAVIDRALFGTDPYRLIPLHGRGLAIMDWLYYWGFNSSLLGLVVWRAWSRAERERFWLAFILTWILLGTVLADLIASAGPIFYREVVGTDGPYTDLLAAIGAADRTFSLTLVTARRYLWDLLQQGRVGVGAGISAFPSLHIATPVLGACASRGSLRLFFLSVTLMLWIGSVTLGWHYAVDGLASILLVPVLWWLTGRLPYPIRALNASSAASGVP